jgi:hypothetical protein
MRSSRGAGRGILGTMIRFAALGAMIAVSGIVAGAAAASGQQAVSVRLAYACRLPSGTRQAAVRIAATFPVDGIAGQAIQPGSVRLAVTLPPPAAAYLAGRGASAVTGTARLAVTVAQGGESATAGWGGLRVPSAPVPASGGLTLLASGTVPPVTPRSAGDITFTAAGLRLVLVLRPGSRSASPSPAPSPAAVPPATRPVVRLACALDASQNGSLATVAVTGTRAAGGRHHRAGPAASQHFCPRLPKHGLKLNPHFPLPTPPPKSTVTSSPEPGCAQVVGYSDVTKLNGAALVGPVLTNLDLYVRVVYNTHANYFEQDGAGELDYKGQHELPPARATFLTFGFMPTTATVQLREIGTIDIITLGHLSGNVYTNTVYALLALRIYGVKVNGVPLNVGANCSTTKPVLLKLTGRSTSVPPYSVLLGGPLAGMITIPGFRGCGVGENLDPLFDASISGPANYVLQTQGATCLPVPPPPEHCPPPVPAPLRSVH